MCMVDHTSCIAHASTTYNFFDIILEIYVYTKRIWQNLRLTKKMSMTVDRKKWRMLRRVSPTLLEK